MKGKEKKIIWKRWWMIVIYVFVGLIVLGSFLPDTENNEADEKTDNSLPLTIEEQIQQDVQKIIGPSNRDVEVIRGIEILDDEVGKTLVISYNVNDNLGNGLIKRGVWTDGAEIFEVMFDKYDSFDEVIISGFFPLTNVYGNVGDGMIMRIGMKRETANKINWDNFLAENLPNVADDYFEHPALNN